MEKIESKHKNWDQERLIKFSGVCQIGTTMLFFFSTYCIVKRGIIGNIESAVWAVCQKCLWGKDQTFAPNVQTSSESCVEQPCFVLLWRIYVFLYFSDLIFQCSVQICSKVALWYFIQIISHFSCVATLSAMPLTTSPLKMFCYFIFIWALEQEEWCWPCCRHD